jgi:hypothetical protein
MRTHYKVLVRIPEKNTTGRSKHRWNSIKMDLKETGGGVCGLDLFGSGVDQLWTLATW